MSTSASSPASQRIVYAVYAAWGLLLAGLMVPRFRVPAPGYLRYFFDDFYFYLVPAESLVTRGYPSFDGTTLTNGFHPLWFLVIAFIRWVCGTSNAPLFVAIGAIIVALTWWTFHAARRLALSLGASQGVALFVGVVVSIGAYRLGRGGMEVCLTIPLGLTFLARCLEMPLGERTPKAAFVLGLLGAIMVLSRLDAALLLITYVAAQIFAYRKRAWPTLAYFSAGGTPVAAYLLLNRSWFGTWLPISGQAKQLKTDLIPRLTPYHLFDLGLHPLGWRYAFDDLGWFWLGFLVPAYVGTAAIAWAFARGRTTLPLNTRAVVIAVLAFPFVFLLAQLCLTDWAIWYWYLYPFAFSTATVLGVSLNRMLEHTTLRAAVGRTILAILSITTAAQYIVYVRAREEPFMRDIYGEAKLIAEFAADNPGRYARGDRAGLLGFLMKGNLVQLEGLAMDAAFLENIRNQRDLLEVLRDYGVDYYVATPAGAPENIGLWCWKLSEPTVHLTGKHTKRMTSLLCDKPVSRLVNTFGVTMFFRVPSSGRGRDVPAETRAPGD